MYLSLASTVTFLIFLECNTYKESTSERTTWDSLEVTATAYNSVESQTKKGNIGLAAWGDTLQLGEKAIAVSRDLIKLGLTHNTEVKIKGLEGVYLVKDKMNKRWKRKIDIYMGLDVEKARNWGKRQVLIFYERKRPERSE